MPRPTNTRCCDANRVAGGPAPPRRGASSPALAAELREFLIQTRQHARRALRRRPRHRRAHRRAALRLRHAARPAGLGRRPPGLSAQGADRAARPAAHHQAATAASRPSRSRAESEYDTFGVGHSSTSISAALGMAVARGTRRRATRRVVAVIGDGAMTRRHGLRGAESRRRLPDRPAGGPQRQRHVDLGERRRAVELLRARALGPRSTRTCARAARRSCAQCPRCGSSRAAPRST